MPLWPKPPFPGLSAAQVEDIERAARAVRDGLRGCTQNEPVEISAGELRSMLGQMLELTASVKQLRKRLTPPPGGE